MDVRPAQIQGFGGQIGCLPGRSSGGDAGSGDATEGGGIQRRWATTEMLGVEHHSCAAQHLPTNGFSDIGGPNDDWSGDLLYVVLPRRRVRSGVHLFAS